MPAQAVKPVAAFDYKACLQRLASAHKQTDEAAILRELQSLPSPDPSIYASTSLQGLTKDDHSTSLLHQSFPDTFSDHIAVTTTGDGNCLFNAASLLITGSEVMANELRARTCIEMMTNRNAYLSHPNADKFILISPSYDEAVESCSVNSAHTCIWVMLALATVLRRKIVSLYPTVNCRENNVYGTATANTTLEPRYGADNDLNPFYLLWTRMDFRSGCPDVWEPNHFVPVVRKHATDEGGPFLLNAAVTVMAESKKHVPASVEIVGGFGTGDAGAGGTVAEDAIL